MNSLHIYTKYALISSISFVSAEVIAIALSAFFIYSIKHGHSIRFKWIKARLFEKTLIQMQWFFKTLISYQL